MVAQRKLRSPPSNRQQARLFPTMTGTDVAQAHDAVALDCATSAYFKFRASLKQEVAENEAVAKKAADEQEKQRDEKMSMMMTMVEKLTCMVEELKYNLAT